MDEITILRNALLDISANRVGGKPTMSAGTAMLALAKARNAEQPAMQQRFVDTAPALRVPVQESPSFLRLP